MLRTQKAFTLIELLVTVAVVGVVLALAVPSFNQQILNNKSTVLSEDLIAQINLARYEAVKRGVRVSICASSDSMTTTPSCTGNWTQGYMIFVDKAATDEATAINLGSTPEIIKVFPKEDTKAVISVKNGSTAVSFIRFTALGTLARISSSTNPISIETSMTGCKGPNKRVITIGLPGLISAANAGC